MGFSLADADISNQGSRWPIYDADFFGLICLADFLSSFVQVYSSQFCS